jgi:sulfatase maturation enzyme AslB (radical SAM superfamily)
LSIDFTTKKILCLGNNTEDTDRRTRYLAEKNSCPCHGLLSELDHPLDPSLYQSQGFYHSSVYDIEFGRLVDIAENFDEVWMLDQPIEQWSHPDSFFLTVKIIDTVKTESVFLDTSYKTKIYYFDQLVKNNPSFCIFPFIELLVNNQHTTVCCRSSTPISPINGLDFSKDKNYIAIRQKMISGELVPEHCSSCYEIEKKGLPSARRQETVEWANRLGLGELADLESISKPSYYEVRASNKCNLQCRMCNPNNSHLIANEYKNIGLLPKNYNDESVHSSGFEIVDFENLRKLYVAGGEPMIMPEFYDFLDKCIDQNRTDFEFLINTNGTKLSKKFRECAKKFSNLQFIFSIDGFEQVNYYIRWPSHWNTIIDNWRYLVDMGHKVTINTTVSIYNISNLYLLYEFIDQIFPRTLVHCQIVDRPQVLSPWLFPDKDLAVSSLERILKTQCCHNDLLFRDSIKGYIDIFQNRTYFDTEKLHDFFEFNDKLDISRKIKLIDYIPQLEFYRKN